MNKEAYNYSIYLLARRDYSAHKMRMKLKSRKYESEEIEELIEFLIDKQYLNEAMYQRGRIKALLLKNYSNSYIVQKLAQEKLSVSPEEIEVIKAEESISDEAVISGLIDRKLQRMRIEDSWEGRQKAKQKILSFLQAKGHNYYLVQESLSQPLDDLIKDHLHPN